MIKYKLITVLFCTVAYHILVAQLPEIHTLLKSTDTAVSGVSEGRYTLHNISSSVTIGEDSSRKVVTINCYFKKIPGDTLAGYKLGSLGDQGYERVYDGHELLTLLTWQKTLEKTVAAKYPKKIKELQHDYFIYPFFTYLNHVLQGYTADSMINKLTLVGTEPVNGEPCYKLQQFFKSGDPYSFCCYYISAVSFLPVRWYTMITTMVGKSRTIQAFDYYITGLHAENIPDSLFTNTALSEYSRVKEYDPSEDVKTNRLLPVGSVAPEWELPLLGGGTLKLSDLRGKIIVMDFWYKACAPCQKQMIQLETISSRFSKDDVVFIGINTIDDPARDKLISFLKNRNITMPTVINGATIEKRYQVYASPALFVIDKNGKIIYTADGYSWTLAEDLAAVIPTPAGRSPAH